MVYKQLISFILSFFFLVTQAFAGLPPTSLKGQSETSPVTTFNFQAPYNQATTTAGSTRLVETGYQNLLLNPSFEATTATTSWTVSNGSAAAETTNLMDGKKSLALTLSAINGDVLSQSVTPTIQMTGLNLEHSIWVKTSLTAVSVCGLQAGSEIQCQTVPSNNTWAKIGVTIAGPSSGSVGIKVKTTSSSTGTIYVDWGYVGLSRDIGSVAQASFIGSAFIATTASCQWTRTNTALGAFGADTDCPGPTVEFNPGPGTIQTTDTDLPKFTVNNLPPGEYDVIIQGSAGMTTASGNAQFAINDGTTTSGRSAGLSLVNELANFTVLGHFSYSSTANRSFEVYASASANTVNLFNDSGNKLLRFSIVRYPSSSDLAISINNTPWYVDATMDGANPSLGVTAITSYTEIADAGLTLKPQSGSAAVGVMCSGTNAATAPSTSNTTCAAGNESVGINFSIPWAGTYEVCSYGSWFSRVDTAEETQVALQLIETPTNAQTLTLEGGTRQALNVTGMTIATGVDQSNGLPFSNCSLFNWASAGTKGVRLMYEQSVVGAPDSSIILMDADANVGQRNLRWTVKPVTRQLPMPLLVGSVTSNSTGLERIERAVINCDAGSAITSQSGSWVSSVGNVSAGACAITLTSGIFSAAPTCTVTDTAVGNPANFLAISASSSTALSVDCDQSGGTDCTSYDVNIHCMGPR